MLQCSQLKKSYGPSPLFEDVSFSLQAGERLGLVGRNGHGKSTLARIICGLEDADDGTVVTPPGYTIGFLEQHTHFTQDTALDVVTDALPELDGGWKETHRAEATLSGLGVDEALWTMPPSALSSGYQLRLRLARVLVGEYNLLVLDEPTNYLDVPSIRWLKQFLQRYPGELLLITHDRLFMDDVSTHIAGIHRGQVKKLQGSTGDYYSFREEEEEQYERERVNKLKKRQSTERFIERFRAKDSKASQVQSRIKLLEKDVVGDALHDIKSLAFSFAEDPFPGRWIVHTEDLGFQYKKDEPLLFQKLNLSVRPGDRLGIIGANGKGKSTLLSLLNGDLTPSEGRVIRSDNTSFACFHSKALQELKGTHSIEAEVSKHLPDSSRTHIRTLCGTMLFEGDDALKPLDVLSGGERARVLLARIIATPSNCLLLDEPTHHLDIESCDALTDALRAYSGTVIFITHDEQLLRQLAERLIVFKDGSAFLFEGGYDDFLDKYGWEASESPTSAEAGVSAPTAKKSRQERAQIVQQYNEQLRPLRKQRTALEESIMQTEETHAAIHEEMVHCASSGEGKQIERLSQQHHELEQKLSDLYNEYEKVDIEITELEAAYERDKQ